MPRFPALAMTALIACATVSAATDTPTTKLPSQAFPWDSLTARATPVGARRDVVNRPTPTLQRFQSHITTLKPGLASHAPHQHPLEEMIIVKDGTLDVTINDATHRAGPGSVLFYAANDFHAVRNVGERDATYVVLNFGTAATATAPAEPAAKSAETSKLRSQVFEWTKLPVQTTKNGERRQIFAAPTVTCDKLSCHATTVKGGEAAHGAHRHADEEVVVVKEGTLEASFNGTTHRGGPGSIFFFASNDEHGLRNAGDTPVTYYIIRVVTESTPAAPAKS